MIAIIDYDAGNIKSVEKVFHKLGYETLLTSRREDILSADHVVLPGVGCFADAMGHLKERHLIPVIHEVIQEKIPFLGICLGLQLLFEESDESPGVPGLSILKGKIRRIPEEADLKVPHIGWNDLSFPHEGKLFAGITGNPYVYFVHSYYLDATDKDIVCATTSYGVRIDASVEAKNVFACQFHPEKSSDVGLRILKNFAEI